MIRITLASTMVCLFAIGCSDGLPTTPTSSSAVTVASQAPEGTTLGAAALQPVRLVQGTIEVGPWYSRQSATLRGTQGFSFDALLGNSEYPGQICFVDPVACRAGATVPLSGQWGGSDLTGAVRWRGETITRVGLDFGAFMSLSGSFVAPPQAETATVVTPFAVTGFIDTPDGIRVQFTGTGTATLQLQWDSSAGEPGNWLVIGSRFEFNAGR